MPTSMSVGRPRRRPATSVTTTSGVRSRGLARRGRCGRPSDRVLRAAADPHAARSGVGSPALTVPSLRSRSRSWWSRSQNRSANFSFHDESIENSRGIASAIALGDLGRHLLVELRTPVGKGKVAATASQQPVAATCRVNAIRAFDRRLDDEEGARHHLGGAGSRTGGSATLLLGRAMSYSSSRYRTAMNPARGP